MVIDGVNVRIEGRLPSGRRNSLPFHSGMISSPVFRDGSSTRTLAAGSSTVKLSSSSPVRLTRTIWGLISSLAATMARRNLGGSRRRRWSASERSSDPEASSVITGRLGPVTGRSGCGEPPLRSPAMAGDRATAGDEELTPVPLPGPDIVFLEPPSDEETTETARGVATAVAPEGGLTDLQAVLLHSLFKAMTGTDVGDPRTLAPLSAQELAEHLSCRELQFRNRGVQVMLLCALVLRPLPEEVIDRISRYARAMSADDGMIPVARRFAQGALGLAGVDFQRNGYTADWDPARAENLHVSTELQDAWASAVSDPALASRWAALGDLPAGTLGRSVWEMYRARGFVFPGLPGSAPPLLAQHDWVHVLADYGTTVESELEVFAFIARANDDMRGFSLLAMVVSLFETGYLRTGAGLFEASSGHLSGDSGVAIRMADAMRRGALCSDRELEDDSVDFMDIDWFSVADLSLEDARARFNVVPKAEDAIAAGSVDPFQRGGISPFQANSGRELAAAEGRPYEGYGAIPLS